MICPAVSNLIHWRNSLSITLRSASSIFLSYMHVADSTYLQGQSMIIRIFLSFFLYLLFGKYLCTNIYVQNIYMIKCIKYLNSRLRYNYVMNLTTCFVYKFRCLFIITLYGSYNKELNDVLTTNLSNQSYHIFHLLNFFNDI